MASFYSKFSWRLGIVCMASIGIVTPTIAADPTINIINYGTLKTSDLEAWTRAGAEHLSDWQADTLGVTWDIGSQVSERFSEEYGFSKHKVTLSAKQQDEISDAITEWVFDSECVKDEIMAFENREGLKNINLWMRGGASVATAPDPCYDRRMVLVARTPDQNKDTIQKIWLHEFYHGHSNYLQNYCVGPRDPDMGRKLDAFEAGRWFAEATAEYFAVMVSSEIQGIKDPVSQMLKKSKLQAKTEGNDLFSDLAANGAVALRLLIERGNFPDLEEDVMSGKVFHRCDWKDKWNLIDNEELRYALNNWHQIQQRGSTWSFKRKVLK